MTAPRLKRAEPRDPGQAQVTARDRLLVLPLIGRVGVASSSQVCRYAGFPSADTCARRLRVLKNKKLVVVHTPGGSSGENLYTLTPQGQAEIKRHIGDDQVRLVQVRRGLPGDLDHDLAVVDAFVDASVAAARSNRFQLVRTVLDWELRAAGAGTASLVPDLVLVVDGPDGQRAFAVEVDRGTISPRRMAQKATLYRGLAQDRRGLVGVPDWVVLVLVPTKRRMNRIAEQVLDLNLPGGFWLYGVEGEVSDRTFFTDVWRTVVATGEDTAGFQAVSPFGAAERPDLAGSSPAASAPANGLPGSSAGRGPS